MKKPLILVAILASACSTQAPKPDGYETVLENLRELHLQADCLEAKEKLDQEDVWLASEGKKRDNLPQSWIDAGWSKREAYDQQNHYCHDYAKYIGLIK